MDKPLRATLAEFVSMYVPSEVRYVCLLKHTKEKGVKEELGKYDTYFIDKEHCPYYNWQVFEVESRCNAGPDSGKTLSITIGWLTGEELEVYDAVSQLEKGFARFVSLGEEK